MLAGQLFAAAHFVQIQRQSTASRPITGHSAASSSATTRTIYTTRTDAGPVVATGSNGSPPEELADRVTRITRRELDRGNRPLVDLLPEMMRQGVAGFWGYAQDGCVGPNALRRAP